VPIHAAPYYVLIVKKKSITERENFLRAVEMRYPRWIPIKFEMFPAVWMKYAQKLIDIVKRHPLIFEDTGEGKKIWFDNNDPLFQYHTYYEDDWGCVWYNVRDGNLGQVVKHPIADWKDIGRLKVPDPAKQIDWAGLKEAAKEAKKRDLPVIGEPESFSQVGFFDRLQFLRGLENLLVDFITEPPELYRLIEIVLDYNLKYIKKYLEIGVDILWFHGDIGSQNGLMFSPDIFRKILKPAYKEMFTACRKAGVHVWYSSDGNLLEIVDDLAECGVSIHDPQVRPNGIDGISKAYRGKMCALVDVDEQMLPFCAPEEIEAQIKEIVDKVGSPEGGLMIYAIPSEDVPLENIEALCTGWEKHCFYGWG
jgi:uroporphyrinogen decarboxylase